MTILCKILGLVDITAAVILFFMVDSYFKFLLVVPLIIKGISSLSG